MKLLSFELIEKWNWVLLCAGTKCAKSLNSWCLSPRYDALLAHYKMCLIFSACSGILELHAKCIRNLNNHTAYEPCAPLPPYSVWAMCPTASMQPHALDNQRAHSLLLSSGKGYTHILSFEMRQSLREWTQTIHTLTVAQITALQVSPSLSPSLSLFLSPLSLFLSLSLSLSPLSPFFTPWCHLHCALKEKCWWTSRVKEPWWSTTTPHNPSHQPMNLAHGLLHQQISPLLSFPLSLSPKAMQFPGRWKQKDIDFCLDLTQGFIVRDRDTMVRRPSFFPTGYGDVWPAGKVYILVPRLLQVCSQVK